MINNIADYDGCEVGYNKQKKITGIYIMKL